MTEARRPGGLARRAPIAIGAALVTLAVATSARADVYYYGGRVLSNVEIVEVSWGSSVDAGYLQQLGGFYQAIVVSPFVDWMTEYDTIGQKGYVDNLPGSNQHIGRGTFGGSVVIQPANTSTALNDDDVQAELAAQLDAGKLPPPKHDAGGNVNTIYMIDFPPGISITLLNLGSCSGFGAYHGTIAHKGESIPYGVHPNCGYSFDTATLIHSHELAEAMTDMEVGLVPPNGPTIRPTGWVTLAATSWASQEVGDVCEGTSDVVAGYTVQKIWSNFAKGCVAQIPICDGSVQPPQCRPCNPFDSGAACSGAKPACATTGAEAGHCVLCTTAYPAACPSATPVCDEPTATCVGCLMDGDCKAPDAPVCDLPTKTCRGCKADKECAKGVCDVAADASAGRCVECNKDATCGAGKQCKAHACVAIDPGPSASSSSGASGVGSSAFTTSGGAGGAGGGAAGDDEGLHGGCACRATESSTEPQLLATAAMLGLIATAGRRRTRRARR